MGAPASRSRPALSTLSSPDRRTLPLASQATQVAGDDQLGEQTDTQQRCDYKHRLLAVQCLATGLVPVHHGAHYRDGRDGPTDGAGRDHATVEGKLLWDGDHTAEVPREGGDDQGDGHHDAACDGGVHALHPLLVEPGAEVAGETDAEDGEPEAHHRTAVLGHAHEVAGR